MDQIGDSPHFTIEMLAAGPGDCLWIEYGVGSEWHRILIDGGVPGTGARIRERADQVGDTCRFELVVVTHVDDDHIGGVLELLEAPPPLLEVSDVWFNGRFDPPDAAIEDWEQGDRLSLLLEKRPWNAAFHGAGVVVEADERPPERTLAGGLVVTVLSPRRSELDALRSDWARAVQGTLLGSPGREVDAAMEEGRPCPRPVDPAARDALASSRIVHDRRSQNASSIIVALEFAGVRVLLGGDGRADVLLDTLTRWDRPRVNGRLSVNALKVAHHGSKNNTSLPLLRFIESRRFLVSTDGTTHCHPDDVVIARIANTATQPEILFSERNHRNEQWWSDPLMAWGYRPSAAEGPIDLMIDPR